MKTIRIYQLNHLAPRLLRHLKEAQMEAAQVWNMCMETHKATQACIMSFTGSERGTSSRCPACGHTHKPKGRNWVCRVCGFRGHRDLVGSVNMHALAFGQKVKFPRSFTYLRPSSSRAGTPQRCLGKSTDQPRHVETVSSETGHTVDVVQKPVTL
ncbi:MAG TPA: zinc ribbon domain-containing protein [Ktedonobacteraceae bacterium]